MGRKSRHKDRDRREQAAKMPRGFARGHGAHHRHKPGKEAPRQFGTGRDRTQEGTRTKDFSRLNDDALGDLSNQEKKSNVERSIEELGDAGSFGSHLEGEISRGTVIEVRKGNFLTRMDQASTGIVTSEGYKPLVWKAGETMRTIVRGTLQQFDLGLASLVAPGDTVEMIVPPMAGEKELHQYGLHGILTRVMPRRNEFRRLHPSGRSIQTLAANVDQIIVVSSAAEPDFRPGFVDRVLVCAAACGLPAGLVLNKIDLSVKDSDRGLLAVYTGLGIPVFEISVLKPGMSRDALEKLKARLAGKRSVLTGHSGVGKSSLLLSLDPALKAVDIRTGDVSTQTGKGTHTTTHAHLFGIDLGKNTELIDTAGVREFTPADTDRRNLWGWFPELARLQGQCSFADCTHTVEQGCAVLDALKRGEIHPRRHESYVRIYQTITG